MSALSINSVNKEYDGLKVVRDLDLTVNAGERVALLGHNGAGKTTLMRMILGLTPLTSGTIRVLNTLPSSREARANIGFLPESVAFQGVLSGREQLHHFARLKSVPTRAADDLLDRVGLAHAADRKIRTYSKGMRQRIGLAQALLGRPKLALLDEPTSGLDPISRFQFYDIVDELAANGTAILLSSHALTELETRTDRIAIMRQGQLVADSTLRQLRENARLPIHVMVTTTSQAADEIAQKLGGTRINGGSVSLTCLQAEKVPTLNQISQFGDVIKDIDVTPASLDSLYRHYSTPSQEAK